jgi:hypothetical protein
MAKKRRPALQWVELAAEPFLASQHFPPIKPTADGHMPLSAAVHWIASRGFKNDHDLTSQEGQLAYSAAAIDLFAKISSDKVHAVGENSDEDPEQLPAVQFSGLASYFDFTDDFEAAGNDRRIEINVSEEGQSRDVLRKAGKRGQWTAVRVSCEDVFQEWPFLNDQIGYRTGAAGRPSSSFLIESELARRISVGLRFSSVSEEADSLLNWLKTTHPDAPPITKKTILNSFRGQIRSQIDARK